MAYPCDAIAKCSITTTLAMLYILYIITTELHTSADVCTLPVARCIIIDVNLIFIIYFKQITACNAV